MSIEEITLCVLSAAVLLMTWRISRLEKLLMRISPKKPFSAQEPIVIPPLVVRKLRTEEQKKAASAKRKEWWAKKRAAEVEPAALND